MNNENHAEKSMEQENPQQPDVVEHSSQSTMEMGDQIERVINELHEQLSAADQKYLRLLAEFHNFRERTAREYDRIVQGANEKLILQLVEIRENLERALQSYESNNDDLLKGVLLIYQQFDQVLKSNGLEIFGETGDRFDPQFFDALMVSPHPQIEADHVAEVFQKGYKLKGQVIRHARVIVSSGQSAT
jgi:molecular chaperone GrpE